MENGDLNLYRLQWQKVGIQMQLLRTWGGGSRSYSVYSVLCKGVDCPSVPGGGNLHGHQGCPCRNSLHSAKNRKYHQGSKTSPRIRIVSDLRY